MWSGLPHASSLSASAHDTGALGLGPLRYNRWLARETTGEATVLTWDRQMADSVFVGSRCGVVGVMRLPLIAGSSSSLPG